MISPQDLSQHFQRQREARFRNPAYTFTERIRNLRRNSLNSTRWNRNYERLVHESGLFDEGFYLSENQDVLRSGADPLLHFLEFGGRELRSPSILFDTAYYVQGNSDVLQSGTNPLVHYLVHGGFEGRAPHWLFDSAFYLRQNPDVASAGMNPLVHYIRFGSEEGRDPHPYFSSNYFRVYLSTQV